MPALTVSQLIKKIEALNLDKLPFSIFGSYALQNGKMERVDNDFTSHADQICVYSGSFDIKWVLNFLKERDKVDGSTIIRLHDHYNRTTYSSADVIDIEPDGNLVTEERDASGGSIFDEVLNKANTQKGVISAKGFLALFPDKRPNWPKSFYMVDEKWYGSFEAVQKDYPRLSELTREQKNELFQLQTLVYKIYLCKLSQTEMNTHFGPIKFDFNSIKDRIFDEDGLIVENNQRGTFRKKVNSKQHGTTEIKGFQGGKTVYVMNNDSIVSVTEYYPGTNAKAMFNDVTKALIKKWDKDGCLTEIRTWDSTKNVWIDEVLPCPLQETANEGHYLKKIDTGYLAVTKVADKYLAHSVVQSEGDSMGRLLTDQEKTIASGFALRVLM